MTDVDYSYVRFSNPQQATGDKTRQLANGRGSTRHCCVMMISFAASGSWSWRRRRWRRRPRRGAARPGPTCATATAIATGAWGRNDRAAAPVHWPHHTGEQVIVRSGCVCAPAWPWQFHIDVNWDCGTVTSEYRALLNFLRFEYTV